MGKTASMKKVFYAHTKVIWGRTPKMTHDEALTLARSETQSALFSARAEIESLQTALRLAVGELSGHKPYKRQRPGEVLHGLLKRVQTVK